MDLASLKIFKSVVEQGGVNKAAAKLNRVPSNVTTRIKQLEEQLGTKLFLRVGRRLALGLNGSGTAELAGRGSRAGCQQHRPRQRCHAGSSGAQARLPRA